MDLSKSWRNTPVEIWSKSLTDVGKPTVFILLFWREIIQLCLFVSFFPLFDSIDQI